MSKIVDRIFNTVLTADDATAQEELGAFRFKDGNIYKYVQFTDSVTAILGAPVMMDATSSYKVTVDISSGSGKGAIVGVALAANTPAYYGWIQTYGVATIKVTDTLTAGDHLVAATTDNFWSLPVVLGTTDSTGYLSGAVALENNALTADGTILALIRCM